ncbi:MAG: hypothetical protein II719_06080 [Clostridia bacterium]|nr:hypothetical protein [Clostridia bacterium]
MESVENQEISLADYIKQAKEGELLDFKVTNYEESNIGRTVSEEDKYRGMIINDGSRRVIASARDVGNIAAGYVSGVKHIPYCAHRIACDYYESISNGGYRTFEGNLYVKWSLEGKSSRLPQRVGWEMGKRQRRKKK